MNQLAWICYECASWRPIKGLLLVWNPTISQSETLEMERNKGNWNRHLIWLRSIFWMSLAWLDLIIHHWHSKNTLFDERLPGSNASCPNRFDGSWIGSQLGSLVGSLIEHIFFEHRQYLITIVTKDGLKYTGYSPTVHKNGKYQVKYFEYRTDKRKTIPLNKVFKFELTRADILKKKIQQKNWDFGIQV